MVKRSGSYRDRVDNNGMFGVPSTPEPFGLFLFDAFNRPVLGTDWPFIGSSTWTPNGPGLDVSGGAGTLTHRMRYGGPGNLAGHAFEDFLYEARIQLNSVPGVSTVGVGFGISDFANPDGQRDIIGQLYMSTSGTLGGEAVIQTFDGTTNAVVAQSAGSLTRNNGEWYRVAMRKSLANKLNTIAVTCVRELDGSTVSTSWTEPLSYPQTSFSFSTGDFAIWSISGNVRIDYVKITVYDLKNVQDLFVGDSITHGAYATNMATRWASNVSDNFSVSAGSGDGTQRVLDRIQNIVNYNAQRVFLMIGGNDILLGVATATYRANYRAIVARLKAEKCKVVHLLATPRTPTDITPLNDWIKSEFALDQIIDTYTPLKGSGNTLASDYDSGDGVHPNQAGHDLIRRTIKANI